MQQIVHKYPLLRQRQQQVSIPYGATAMHIHEQDGRVCIWAVCPYPSFDVPDDTFDVLCISTGEPVPEDWSFWYRETCHIHGGNTVVHVFMRPASPSVDSCEPC